MSGFMGYLQQQTQRWNALELMPQFVTVSSHNDTLKIHISQFPLTYSTNFSNGKK